MRRIRGKLSYANVVATLALFIALGGTSYAALTITGNNVKNVSLTGRDVKRSPATPTPRNGRPAAVCRRPGAA